MRLALLENPRSGGGEADDVAGALRARGAEVQSFPLAEADAAIAWGPQRIAVAGGDGSLGCGAEAAASASVPFAVIPVGTANDFARAMEIPSGLDDAARLAVEGSRTRRLELARMGSRPFVNVASVGLAPIAAHKAHGLKRLLGPAAYAVGGIRAGLTAQPVPCRVRCDGEISFAGEAWQATVACSGAFGGGAEVEADPQDGLLDVVVIEAGSRAALARRAYGLRRGTLAAQRGVRTYRAREVELDVPEGTHFNVDGEVVQSGPVAFAVEHDAVEVVVA